MYKVWKIRKRGGGFRFIEAPEHKLKEQQWQILKVLEKKHKASPFAHGFQYYKNIVTMAIPHVGKKWVACMDIEDFFPSIKYEYFQKPLRTLASVCFHDFKDKKGLRLPQGAPTSPLLSNLHLFSFDWRMAWLAHSFGCDYSRYADDIVISGDSKRHIAALFKVGEAVLDKHYCLKINHKKTKFMHTSQRQLVCGVVVNEKINLPRRWRKRLRAEVFQKGGELPEETKGRLSFKDMVLMNKKTTYSSREIIDALVVAKKLGT
jgi:RNA-directed DNA polymerase